jgi:hypothetical protein
MSIDEERPGSTETVSGRLTVSAAWRVVWRRLFRRLFLLFCALGLIAAGCFSAYLMSYRKSYAVGFAEGYAFHEISVRTDMMLEWYGHGSANAFRGLSLFLSKGKLDGLSEGWCLLKLGEKPTQIFLSTPVEDVRVLHRGKEYALNVDGTVWYRE